MGGGGIRGYLKKTQTKRREGGGKREKEKRKYEKNPKGLGCT